MRPKQVAVNIIYNTRYFDEIVIGFVKTKTVTPSGKHYLHALHILFLYTGHWTVYCARHTAVLATHTRNLRKRMGKEILDHG
jgi:hypothetical protein